MPNNAIVHKFGYALVKIIKALQSRAFKYFKLILLKTIKVQTFSTHLGY
jgi:hypothetical protein